MSNESIYGVRLSNDFIAICIASCVRSIEGVIDFDRPIHNCVIRRANSTASLADTENCKKLC